MDNSGREGLGQADERSWGQADDNVVWEGRAEGKQMDSGGLVGGMNTKGEQVHVGNSA